MIFQYLFKKRVWDKMDRLGPDCPSTHKKLFYKESMLEICKEKFKYFHETADFRPFAFAHYPSMISIGKRVVIRPLTVLSGDPGAEIIIEDDVLLGAGVHIYVDNHDYRNTEKPIYDQGCFPSQSVIIKKGSWLGANVIVLPGVTIGKNSVIGAGSVVTKSIPDYCVAVGNPAKVIRKLK